MSPKVNHHAKQALNVGGRGGSRTHGRIAPTPDFESGALNHSATLPTISLKALPNELTAAT